MTRGMGSGGDRKIRINVIMPSIEGTMRWKYLMVDRHMRHLLSSHGLFKTYLLSFQRAEDDECNDSRMADTPFY